MEDDVLSDVVPSNVISRQVRTPNSMRQTSPPTFKQPSESMDDAADDDYEGNESEDENVGPSINPSSNTAHLCGSSNQSLHKSTLTLRRTRNRRRRKMRANYTRSARRWTKQRCVLSIACDAPRLISTLVIRRCQAIFLSTRAN